jgi:bifunctional DNase/RNase
MLAAFHVQILEVTLTALEEGIFRATLVCEQEGHEWRFDARPSDAIAMALRQQAPLFATQEVVRSAGEQMENGSVETSVPAAPAVHSAQPTDELRQELQDALANEDYERAASLRDELHRRGAL